MKTKFMQPIESPSDEIKARRWLGYLFLGVFSRKYRLEIEHYKNCGEFAREVE